MLPALLAGVTFWGLAVDARAMPDPFKLYGGNISFNVERNGKKIGTHVTRFSRRGSETVVRSTMNLDVKVLGFTAYSMRYNSTERWQDKVLKMLSVGIDDDGAKTKISGRLKGGKFSWSTNGKWRSSKAQVFPTNHWNKDVLSTRRVLNTLTGFHNRVRIKKVGSETLTCGKRRIRANRYVYSGQLQTESWYDRNGRWVGLRFKAKDGSTLFFKCRK